MRMGRHHPEALVLVSETTIDKYTDEKMIDLLRAKLLLLSKLELEKAYAYKKLDF